MFVLIAGGGRTGSRLASLLLNEGHKVKIVEARPVLLARLHQELATENIVEGNPMEPPVLEQAGVREAHVLAAMTSEDPTNLCLCFMGKKMFEVPRTIARVNNANNAWLFDSRFLVDVALNQADVLAHLIQEEMSLGDMMTVFKIRRGRYAVVEEKVPEGAMGIGVALKDMGLEEQCVIAAIIREGKMTLPKGESMFMAGDEIIAVASPEGAQKLSALLAHPVYPVRKPRKKAENTTS